MFIFFQFNPWRLIGDQPLERFPAALSLLYVTGVGLVVLLLLLFVLLNRKRKSSLATEAEENLPEEVRQRLGSTAANRALWIFRVVFVLLAFSVYGFHVYWALYAAEKDPHFARLSERDIRVKRVSASELRGWILDRNGDLKNALAFWRVRKQTGENGRTDEDLIREYPLEREMAHLLGTERGSPGLERTLFAKKNEVTPEALDVVLNTDPPQDDRDVRTTIERDLQKFVYEQLDVQEKQGRHGAVVALNPQTGDVYAIASTPSFSLSDARDLDKYRQLEANQKDKPLVSRALREYYVPGSTFKTFTMIAAYRANQQNQVFTSSGGGFVAYRNARPIRDANGGCEPPYGCAPLNIAQAFEVSSNQYFSRMAVELGRQQLRETASLVGINAAETPEEALRSDYFPSIWNASSDSLKGALAPRQAAIVTGEKITLYDLALQGMGQGYAGEMTPLQMALIAAVAGNLNGNLMKPKIELERAPEVFASVLSPNQAAQIREIMGLVVDGPGGTAHVVRRMVGPDMKIGGKTGTAEKQVPVFDAKTGKVKTETRKRQDKNGNWVEYQRTVLTDRTDSWFISIAPLEKPQIAIAVVVEGGGFGARTAAPIAANTIIKAQQLGLLGEEYRQKAVTPAKNTNRQTPRITTQPAVDDARPD